MLDFVYDVELNNSSIKTKLYYNYLNNVLDSYDDISYTQQESKNAYQETMDNYALGSDIFYRNHLNSTFLLKSAFRYRYEYNRRQQDSGEEWQSHNLNTFSLPVEVEWRMKKLLSITAGISFDMLLFSGDLDKSNNATTSFNPQVAFLLKTSETLGIKLSASRKTRFPTVRELFSPISGNLELQPMKAGLFELGILYSPKADFNLSLTGFYNNVKNLISRKNRNNPYENIATALFTGVEMSLETSVGRNLDLDLAYTYLNAEDKTLNLQESIEYRPKHKLDAGLFLKLPEQFVLNVNAGLVSSQYYYKDGERRELDPYTMIDFRLSKKIKGALEVHIRVRNLFDVNYYESDGYPREGRMIYGGIQIGF